MLFGDNNARITFVVCSASPCCCWCANRGAVVLRRLLNGQIKRGRYGNDSLHQGRSGTGTLYRFICTCRGWPVMVWFLFNWSPHRIVLGTLISVLRLIGRGGCLLHSNGLFVTRISSSKVMNSGLAHHQPCTYSTVVKIKEALIHRMTTYIY